MASATLALISLMSGSAVLIIGGTSDSVETFWLRALSARSMNRPTSLGGMLVEIIAELAWAIFSKLRSAVCGLICSSIALITHFWRAIRE